MIPHYITHTFIVSALILAPGIQAAQQSDKLDELLTSNLSAICYKTEETGLQKSWRLAKEYGPFATSVALGSYLACKSMPHHGHLDRVPGFLASGINAYALYKSYTMTKEWLKQLPKKRIFPARLLLPCVTSLATYIGFERFFEPSYIVALSSATLCFTSLSNYYNACKKHAQDKSIIYNTETALQGMMYNDYKYSNRDEQSLDILKTNEYPENMDLINTRRACCEIHFGRLYTYRESNKILASRLDTNVRTIIQQPWGSHFIAGLSKNARHAIYKSVGWEMDQINNLNSELNMNTKNYPEEFVVPKSIDSIYAPITN